MLIEGATGTVSSDENGTVSRLSGAARLFASTINDTRGRTLANNAAISAGPEGSINIFNSGTSPLAILIGVNGDFK